MLLTYAMRPPEPEDNDETPQFGSEKLSSPCSSNSPISSDESPVGCSPILMQPNHVEKIIHVPTRKVGYLIGYQGRTILGFERDTGAKINILAPNSRDSETPVSLTGPTDSVRHVIRMITDLYGCNNYSSQLWAPRLTSNGCKWNETIATEEIRVEAIIAGLLIGARGDLIANIELKTGAKITFHQDQEDGSGAPINVTGSLRSNIHALDLLRTKISEFETLLESGAIDLKSVHVHLLQKRKVWTVEKIRESYSKKRSWNEMKEPSPQGRHFGNTGHPPRKKKSSHFNNNLSGGKASEDKIQVTGHELDTVNLEAVALMNNVEIEVVNLIGKATQSGGLKHINIRGSSVQIHNAKLDILREIAHAETSEEHLKLLTVSQKSGKMSLPK